MKQRNEQNTMRQAAKKGTRRGKIKIKVLSGSKTLKELKHVINSKDVKAIVSDCIFVVTVLLSDTTEASDAVHLCVSIMTKCVECVSSNKVKKKY